MNDADYTRLARTGAVCTFRRRRERRIKLALTVLIVLATVALVAWSMT